MAKRKKLTKKEAENVTKFAEMMRKWESLSFASPEDRARWKADTFATRYMGPVDALAFHADNLASRFPKHPLPDLAVVEKAAMAQSFRRRDPEVRAHTVLPMHKSNYIVVTDMTLLKVLGKKP